ncbi:hypothetical protein ABW20_dc0109612 [Dactylellina cionopaga]|nr:hypothetical protein ABW20_dc0109612 [Dactylellina cionopaga]
MKVLFFVVLFFAINPISAFDIRGAYERIFFWYAYRLQNQIIDAHPDGSKEPKIGVGCVGTAPKRRCTLAEFIKHVTQTYPDDTAAPSIPDPRDEMDIDRVAKLINRYPTTLTGVIIPSNIFDGVSKSIGAESLVQCLDQILITAAMLL